MTLFSFDQIHVLQKEPQTEVLAKDYLCKALEPVWNKISQALSHRHLFPLIWTQAVEGTHSQITLFCLGPFQNRFFKYFYEYSLRACEPEIVDPISFSAVDFILPFKETSQRLTLCQICLDLPSPALVKKIEKKFQKSSSYLKLGQMTVLLESPTEAEREPQEEEHRHKLYDLLFQTSSKIPPKLKPFVTTKLQQILASTPRNFLYERSPRHLVNLAVQMANMHVKAQGAEKTSKRRAWVHHRSHLVLGFKRPQKVECWVITLNFLKANEVLEERHLFQVLRQLAPNLQRLQCFIFFRDPESKLIHFYIEVLSDQFEKSQRKRLPSLAFWMTHEVLRRIERKPLAIFTARNEEESIKWLSTLSKEVSSKSDIPQIALMFHNQNDDKLLFHLLIARPYLTNMLSLQQILSSNLGEYELSFHFDKVKKIEGDHFHKELCLVEVEIPKAPFLREDYCVNIQKARHWLIKTLQAILGPIRDFNGGLIAKQQEIFEILEKEILSGPLIRNRILFEDLFFNLQPSPLISSFETPFLLNWMQCLVEKRAQSYHSKQIQRLLFEEKGQVAGIWFMDLSDERLEHVRQRINESLRYDREVIWTSLRQSSPSIFGCLIKTKSDTHKNDLQLLKQLVPRSVSIRRTKQGTSE